MEEFFTQVNKKLYYFTVIIVITLMMMGLLIGNKRFEKFEAGFIFHSLLVIILPH